MFFLVYLFIAQPLYCALNLNNTSCSVLHLSYKEMQFFVRVCPFYVNFALKFSILFFIKKTFYYFCKAIFNALR